LHLGLSESNRDHYKGTIPLGIITPIRAGLVFGEDRGELVQLVISLILKLEETTSKSSPDVHTRAVAYIDELSQYTHVQQLDNTFWGQTSSSRVKGEPYVRKNKRPIDTLVDTTIIEAESPSTMNTRTITLSSNCSHTDVPHSTQTVDQASTPMATAHDNEAQQCDMDMDTEDHLHAEEPTETVVASDIETPDGTGHSVLDRPTSPLHTIKVMGRWAS
jgi:hypothetical protein